jgi:hypothetical protein
MPVSHEQTAVERNMAIPDWKNPQNGAICSADFLDVTGNIFLRKGSFFAN